MTAMGLRRALANFWRCMPYLDTFRDWYQNPAHPALREALARRPSLVACVWRPYLHAGWSARQKLDVIGQHYRMLRGRLGFLRFAPSQAIALANAGEGVQIRLEKPSWFEHEGELTLSLFRGELRLYSLAFTLGRLDTRCVAYAGALQGLHSADAIGIYRALAHRMHGLRTRDLLVVAFRMLSASLGVHRILGISDCERVCDSAYFTSKAAVFASYDAAWTEQGGVALANGFFELIPQLVQRPTNEIPSRKRAQYRRRYAMLERLMEEIDRSVRDAALQQSLNARAQAGVVYHGGATLRPQSRAPR